MKWTPVVFALAFAACAAPSTPLPDVSIKQPAAAVPKELSAFSGTWTGMWNGRLPTTLVVEEIDGRNAKLVYSWGAAPYWNISPGYERASGQFGDDNVLRASLSDGTAVSYRMMATGALEGRMPGADAVLIRR